MLSKNDRFGEKVPFILKNYYTVIRKPDFNDAHLFEYIREFTEKKGFRPHEIGYVFEISEFHLGYNACKDFINKYCRQATLEEAKDCYEKLYSDACSNNSTYSSIRNETLHYLVLNPEYNDSVSKYFDLEEYNRSYEQKLTDEMKECLTQLCQVQYLCIPDVEFGFTDGKFFMAIEGKEYIHYGKTVYSYGIESLLKIFRRANQDEVAKFVEHDKYMSKMWKEALYARIDAMEKARKEALDMAYQNHKDDPEFFPGACGKFKQVMLGKEEKQIHAKPYSIENVREFYDCLLNNLGLSDEIKRNFIFYGGTVPYILCDEKDNARMFGDVDIFLPVKYMVKLREELKEYLEYISDSLEFTRCIGLVTDVCDKKLPRTYRDGRGWLYQDYGFKAKIFGNMTISVFPIYDWNFDDGSIGICAKSYRVSEKYTDHKFLLNTIISKGIAIDDFGIKETIFGQETRVAPLEYTIATKKTAAIRGYHLREETDNFDLRYIDEHRDVLNISDDAVDYFLENVPLQSISKIYKIERRAKPISWEEYRKLVFLERCPS